MGIKNLIKHKWYYNNGTAVDWHHPYITALFGLSRLVVSFSIFNHPCTYFTRRIMINGVWTPRKKNLYPSDRSFESTVGPTVKTRTMGNPQFFQLVVKYTFIYQMWNTQKLKKYCNVFTLLRSCTRSSTNIIFK